LPRYVKRPTIPIKVDDSDNVACLLRKMGDIGFQGRNLSSAANAWRDMLMEGALVFTGLARGVVPAGVRRLLAVLIQTRYINCLVSSGAIFVRYVLEHLAACGVDLSGATVQTDNGWDLIGSAAKKASATSAFKAMLGFLGVRPGYHPPVPCGIAM